MTRTGKASSFWLPLVIAAAVIGLFALIAIPNFVREPCTSSGNACINNLRQIDGAKEEWVLEHNAKTNDVVTRATSNSTLNLF